MYVATPLRNTETATDLVPAIPLALKDNWNVPFICTNETPLVPSKNAPKETRSVKPAALNPTVCLPVVPGGKSVLFVVTAPFPYIYGHQPAAAFPGIVWLMIM